MQSEDITVGEFGLEQVRRTCRLLADVTDREVWTGRRRDRVIYQCRGHFENGSLDSSDHPFG